MNEFPQDSALPKQDNDSPQERPSVGPEARDDESPAPTVGIVDGEEHAVDPRSIVVARLVAIPWIAGIALINFVGGSIAWIAGGVPTRIWLLLVLVWALITATALLIGYRWPALHHRYLRYRVDESGVRIRRGVLWRKVISIPTSRVQHTDVAQGPLQRHHGIATLTVYTAGTEGASISLSGLEHGVARRLRDHLLPDHVPDGD